MVEVVDHNRVSKDKVLGSCEIDLEEVNGAVAKSAGDANAANGAGTGWEVENVWKKLFVHEKQKGSVRYDLKWYPVNNDGPSDARSGTTVIGSLIESYKG
ncbi:hypothetical protein BKA69DRAFT_1126721 [Paraphysoderma sedebokerense]|nr:hypothetical protein BKA69DRAFT_1126721 [Paraphysoderma sedebokerense]